MKPNDKLITINDNNEQIKSLINELVLQPRINALKWSKITKQTPNIKIGYPGQHLASLITGMSGERTGARGNDLIDGSEVKSCSRIDQLDICKDCKSPVSRSESVCSSCNSSNIKRNDDSKWLFSVKNENDLHVLTTEVPRILLMIGDYPNFEKLDFETLRFQTFEIWNNSPRTSRFKEIITNYYNKIYLAHKSRNSEKTPAPKNFWPYSYQFYVSNPILIFSCTVTNASTDPIITIDYFVEPELDRTSIESVPMPTDLLSEEELNIVIKNCDPTHLLKMIHGKSIEDFLKLTFKEKKTCLPKIDEMLRSYLPLRDTDKISVAKNEYTRRKTS